MSEGGVFQGSLILFGLNPAKLLISTMSQVKEAQIYTYSLSVLTLTLKVKFPCRLFLEYQGKPLTSEVPAATPNRFTFNQEISLRNDSDKDFLEVVVQLVTEKGAKYVGGVVRLAESELIASEGERMLLPISKCLDNQALCEIRVDQVTISRIAKRQEIQRHTAQKSDFQPDINVLWSNQKHRQAKEAETKSEYNFPLSIVRNKQKGESRVGEHNLIINNRKNLRVNDSVGMEKEPALSVAGMSMSPLEFEVYKEGYNKLKEKYRKQAESARSQMNKRMAVQASENNLKLEVMRNKLKSQELEKALNDRSIRIKELNDTITALQKKEMDIKYLKEEVENKNYTIKNLEETVKTLTKDHNELKGMQSQRYQNQQESVRNLRDQVDKIRQKLEQKEEDYVKELKLKVEIVAKKEYELHSKNEELERTRCTLEDIEKSLTNKTFEWEKIQQSERILSKSKQEELKAKIAAVYQEKAQLEQTIIELEQSIEDKNSRIVKMDYQQRIILQNSENMQKQIEELKSTKDRLVELTREHKLLQDERNLIQKLKEKDIKQKQHQVDQINEKFVLLIESSKKTIKELQEKLKTSQTKSIEVESQSETLKNQLEKVKRMNEVTTKELNEAKAIIKQLKKDIKDKQNMILSLNSELNQSKNRTNQSDYSIKLELNRTKQQLEKTVRNWESEKLKGEQLEEMNSILEEEKMKLRLEWQARQQRLMKDYSIAKERANSLENAKTDLQTQLSTAATNFTNSKVNEKTLQEKVQKLELETIKNKQVQQKSKKQVKLLQEKLISSDNNIKTKNKTIEEHIFMKQSLIKRTSDMETQINLLKGELTKSNNDLARSQKINQILQIDLSKSKEEQAKLIAILNRKSDEEQLLREEIKKQKEEYTKLDMKLNSLKKEYQKFKDILSDNINTVFTSIPEGLYAPTRSSKQISLLTLERTAKLHENSQILNTLASFGREARTNMVKIVEQLRQSQRENERLNAEFSSSLNKNNSLQFEHNQAITNLQEQIEEIISNNQEEHDQFEEEVFSLEGKLREKEAAILQLTQKVEELDYCWKTTKGDFERYRDDSQKKDAIKTKQISELKDQIDDQLNCITELEVNREKLTETLAFMDKQSQQNEEILNKYEKQLLQTKSHLDEAHNDIDQLKKDLKKANERIEEQVLELITIKDQNEQLLITLVEEERKSSELRQFVSTIIKEKEEIIKKDVEKGEQIIEYSSQLEASKHQIDELEDAIRKLKKNEEENRDTIKKLVKSQKQIEISYNQEKTKANRFNEKLRQRQGELNLKNDSLSKLQDNLRREKDKNAKYSKQLEAQLDQLRIKTLNSEKQYNLAKLILENQIQKLTIDLAKATEGQLQCEEHLFSEKNISENLLEQIKIMEQKHQELQESNSQMLSRITDLEEGIQNQQEEMFKVQSKAYALQKNIELKQQEKNEYLQNLHEDWCSRYESMCQQFEQRLQLVDKQKEFLKKKVEQKDKDIKKVGVELKQQEINVFALKKNYEEKIKAVEDDRLAVLAQKNVQNQRLIEQSRLNFENLKVKESECRKLTVDLEGSKAILLKKEVKLKECEQKLKSLNKNHLQQIQEFKKKQQFFKKTKESIVNSIWKNEREVRNIVQARIRKILNAVDETNTLKVMQAAKGLEQSILLAISIKIEDQ